MPDLSNDISKGWWLTSPKPEIARQIIVADYYVIVIVIRMWIASFTSNSLAVLARSITETSSHLMGWWFIPACSANADFSSTPF